MSSEIDERCLQIQNFIDRIFQHDASSNQQYEIPQITSIIQSQRNVDQSDKNVDDKTARILETLELLIELNEEMESKWKQRDDVNLRDSEQFKSKNDALKSIVVQNFVGVFRHLQLNPDVRANLDLLSQFWSIQSKSSSSPPPVDGLVGIQGFLVANCSAMQRREFASIHRRGEIAEDCRDLERKIQQLTIDKGELDIEFDRKLNDQSENRDEIDRMRKAIDFMRRKSRRYLKARAQFDDQYRDLFGGDDPMEFTRDRLAENDRRIKQLRGELAKLDGNLEQYRGLPTDIELAKSKLDEAKKELEEWKKREQEIFQ